ncbi:uncharacterized protein EV154DRAFT_549670 [Mucor mucedo]|uniref:uncharacterized protein n=1 Tax=Mucor mucedo TaxID=29922 RepID=UPI00221E7FAE|nr:uncharacterized protein EV154DRAFT_549670 [Mucor mucedo]KAI7893758.1 hypothetical protein EV154DRAFT_549670 [Mucor mucedo]
MSIQWAAWVSASLSTDSADVDNRGDILLGYQNLGGRIIVMALNTLLTCTPLPHGFGQLLVAGAFNQGVCGRWNWLGCLRLSQQIQQMLTTGVIFSWGTKIWAGESLLWRQTILLTCTPLPHGFGQLLVAGAFNQGVCGRFSYEYARSDFFPEDVGSVKKGSDKIVKRIYL